MVNADDSWGRRLIKEFSGESVEVVSYGLGAMADVRASSPSYTLTGTEFSLTAAGREFFVRVPLVGVFNVYNVLAAVASARAMGLNVRESVRNLASAPQVPGRLELISESSPFQVFCRLRPHGRCFRKCPAHGGLPRKRSPDHRVWLWRGSRYFETSSDGQGS